MEGHSPPSGSPQPSDQPRALQTPRGQARAGSDGHSIRVAAQRTSIDPSTLRIWERRYGFPKPARSAGGGRVYSEGEIEALCLIAEALRRGYRAGEVVGRSIEELTRLLLDAASTVVVGTPHEFGAATIERVVAATLADDFDEVRTTLQRSGHAMGPKSFVVDVAQPLARHVGDLWARGALDVRHEHAITECLSSQLRLLAISFKETAEAPRVLLTTLPTERHGLGLEMVRVYLAASGVTPRALGVDTPPHEVLKAAVAQRVSAVGLTVTRACDSELTRRNLQWLLGELPRRISIWLGGEGIRALGIESDGVRGILSWTELDAAIATLRPSEQRGE